MVLVSGGSKTLRRYLGNPCVGQLLRPGQGNVPMMRWAGDNGAFSGFDPVGFSSMLARLLPHRSSCIFIAAPDVVGDWRATRDLWEEWAPIILGEGYPAAYVLQDGQPASEVPWSGISAVFVGGTTIWKMGTEAAELCRQARERRLWVHVGRVNSLRRMEYAAAIGGVYIVKAALQFVGGFVAVRVRPELPSTSA